MDANDASSPGSLSSPPHSPEQGTPNSTIRVSAGGVGVGGATTPGNVTSSPAPRGLTASGQPRKKPGPKPKAKDPNAPEPEKKSRKPRKPAEPKDPNAQPVQRKRRTKASLEPQTTPAPEPVDEKPPVQQSPTPQTVPSEPAPTPQPELPPAVTQAPRVLSNPEPTLHSNPNLSHISVAPSTPRPSSSGQRYDPIRGGVFRNEAPGTSKCAASRFRRRSIAQVRRPSITSLIRPTFCEPFPFYPQPVASFQHQNFSHVCTGSLLPAFFCSGLLSGTPFGPVASGTGTGETPGANIWLTFDLKGRENVTINFAQEVEKKYGFAALHPRIAARRERQRQITAAGAALERAQGGGSNDDMSVDLSENESNVEMGGMDDETSARENGGKKRRKRKQEDYDKEDDFIDDTELAWEQQALMAKDGFFVYSGPLVTDEKPAVERADGTVRRGRGRGRGGTARGDAAGRGRGRGGGPGSRGGSTVRKPRVTKADRAMMEQEKKERETLAQTIAAKQPVPAYAGAAGAS
ncbi:hypothetical protein SNOG_15725 [Parastagonospora nodorum SN15]|uniref:Hpc2-related domain-containing protein n=1 Tax=Phaeosphaeria nodorum (strain SN15 / ATCC MYA-4574 / FGSC 10173) TaxID=321614 RepID=Q0TXH2_PHANO|nr:hypothetical protein SNOG_15725 [Parastagonospora nodorum SN15]EAT76820.2 hypothetical protein SNOG_15725 [Parastagonospora nodorum SN15]